MMVLNYLSFPFFASLYVLCYFAWKKYDSIFVQQLSPIFVVFPAILLKKIRHIPLYIWVLDIWPNALQSAAAIHNEKILNIVGKFVQWTYRNCTTILVSSKRFIGLVEPLNKCHTKIVYFPNWSEDFLALSDNYRIPKLPEGFIIMIAR